MNPDSVFKRLIEIPANSEIKFNPQRGTEEQWKQFLEATKEFILNERKGITDYIPGFIIEISSDYTGVRKIRNH